MLTHVDSGAKAALPCPLRQKEVMTVSMTQSEEDPADDSKAYRTIRLPEATTSPNPEEGLRLVRAFLRLKNPALREAVIHFVEDLAGVDQTEKKQ